MVGSDVAPHEHHRTRTVSSMAKKSPKTKGRNSSVPAKESSLWWVVGGSYPDGEFHRANLKEERYGPFASYQAAVKEWKARSWAAVDDAWVRFRVVPDGGSAAT